jgi:hypothetical protein
VSETTTTVVSAAVAAHHDWFDYLQFGLVAVAALLAGWGVYLMIATMRRSRTGGRFEGWHIEFPSNGQILMTVNVRTSSGNTTLRSGRVDVRSEGTQLPLVQSQFPHTFSGHESQTILWSVTDTGQTELEVSIEMKFQDRGKLRTKQTLHVTRPGG